MSDPEFDAQDLERELLGGERQYTRLEVAELSGVPIDRCVELWRALGFADVDDDVRAFTDREQGHSKMSRAIVLEAIWKVPLLRLRALRGRL